LKKLGCTSFLLRYLYPDETLFLMFDILLNIFIPKVACSPTFCFVIRLFSIEQNKNHTCLNEHKYKGVEWGGGKEKMDASVGFL